MSDRVYTVGEVTRATGLSKHVLHKWERRYAAVDPQRSPAGHRRYTEADLQRLQRLARLTEGGHSIGHLVTLSDAQLAELRVDPARTEPVLTDPVRVLAIGTMITATVRARRELFATPNLQIELREEEPDLVNLPAELDPTVDVLLVELPALAGDATERLARLGNERARALIVVYHFAARATLAALMDAGVTCLKAPLNAELLAQQVRLVAQQQQSGAPALAAGSASLAVPPRRFSRRVLAELVGQAPHIKCECPNHIAQLLIDLGAFEQYSLACEDMGPEDRELHAYLRWVAAASRSLLEDALERVAEIDGIDIDALA